CSICSSDPAKLLRLAPAPSLGRVDPAPEIGRLPLALGKPAFVVSEGLGGLLDLPAQAFLARGGRRQVALEALQLPAGVGEVRPLRRCGIAPARPPDRGGAERRRRSLPPDPAADDPVAEPGAARPGPECPPD